jgi:tetratricopeptide (TPR) repeat protein
MLIKLGKIKTLYTPWMLYALLYMQIFYGFPPRVFAIDPADDQSNFSALMDQAEELYYAGNLDRSIELVDSCLKNNSPDESERARAYKILIRIYLAKNEAATAKEFVNSILELDPDYQPTIEEETPKFVNLVDEVRTERLNLQLIPVTSADSSGISPWLWIGAGSAAIITIIAIISAKPAAETVETAVKPLPEPPAYPQ